MDPIFERSLISAMGLSWMFWVTGGVLLGSLIWQLVANRRAASGSDGVPATAPRFSLSSLPGQLTLLSLICLVALGGYVGFVLLQGNELVHGRIHNGYIMPNRTMIELDPSSQVGYRTMLSVPATALENLEADTCYTFSYYRFGSFTTQATPCGDSVPVYLQDKG